MIVDIMQAINICLKTGNLSEVVADKVKALDK